MTTIKATIRGITLTILVQLFTFAAPHSARGKAYIVGPRDVLSITCMPGGNFSRK